MEFSFSLFFFILYIKSTLTVSLFQLLLLLHNRCLERLLLHLNHVHRRQQTDQYRMSSQECLGSRNNIPYYLKLKEDFRIIVLLRLHREQ